MITGQWIPFFQWLKGWWDGFFPTSKIEFEQSDLYFSSKIVKFWLDLFVRKIEEQSYASWLLCILNIFFIFLIILHSSSAAVCFRYLSLNLQFQYILRFWKWMYVCECLEKKMHQTVFKVRVFEFLSSVWIEQLYWAIELLNYSIFPLYPCFLGTATIFWVLILM